MNLLDNPEQITSTIKRLLRVHKSFRFMVAWATSNVPVFNLLKKHSKKIGESIVGVYFYQTDPKFIETFLRYKNVKYNKQTSGVFHPKVYYFESSDNWDLIVGSANFTAGGLNNNTEICLHISSKDEKSEIIRRDILKKFNTEFKVASPFTQRELNNYREHHERSKRHMQKVAGNKPKTIKKDYNKRSPFTIDLLNIKWKKFYNRVLKENNTTQRIAILNAARQRFQEHTSFGDMDFDTRREIAGFWKGRVYNWKWFGSTNAAPKFTSAINNNNKNIDRAIDAIPLVGDVTESDYLKSVEYFKKASIGNNFAGFTRLLAMKRPDWFVCLNGPNGEGFEKEYGVKIDTHEYGKYWDEIIIPTIQSFWWDSEEPENKKEKAIWLGRVAFLDALFYQP